ncbi:sensor histidine kinase [Glycomyces scopariae]
METTSGPPGAARDGTADRRTLAGDPLRFLASPLPWRALGFLLTGWLVALMWTVSTLALLLVPALGLVLLLGGVPLAAVERRRLRWVDPAPAPSPHAPPVRPGPWGWAGTRFRERATWRELGYALCFALALAWADALVGLLVPCVLYLLGFPLLTVALPEYQPDRLFGLIPAAHPEAFLATALGLALLPFALYLVTAYALWRVRLTRFVLVGGEAGADRRVRELSLSRERIMDAMDAQRRRIERDLHDGAQQRLTGLILSLGVARLELAEAPEPARDAVDEAYRQARTALSELRELVHGIHPQVLTNRGLAPAVAELADRCPVPVDVAIHLPDRPPEPVEAAAWFITAEALTNAAKHSGATRAWIRCHRRGRSLLLEVGDDGTGGADPSRGTGLLGLADRVSVLHGRIEFDSPAGGPTLLRAELPCDW